MSNSTSFLLGSGRAPSHFQRYRAWNLRHGRVVNTIPLPNSTRVSGCQIMFQGLIRDKWSLCEYATHGQDTDGEWKSKFPTAADWDLLAQFEGILAPLQKCSMSLQTDDPGANSGAMLEAYFARHVVSSYRTNGVPTISMNREDYAVRDLWDGSASLALLSEKRKNIPFDSLKEPAKLLIARLLKEYETYFLKEKDTTGEKAILANPLLCYFAPYFFMLRGIFSEHDKPRLEKHFVDNMVDNFSNRHSQIGAAFARQKKQPPAVRTTAVSTAASSGSTTAASAVSTSTSTTTTTEPVPQPVQQATVQQATAEEPTATATAEEPTTELQEPTTTVPAVPKLSAHSQMSSSFFGDFFRIQKATTEALASITGTAALADKEEALRQELRAKCKQELAHYLTYCEAEMKTHWSHLIEKWPSRLYLETSKKWNQQQKEEFMYFCSEYNFIELGKYFDVLGWWRDNQVKFPHVFVTAIVWLTCPATNAFQERVFSLCSWFDSNKLMRRQTGKTFEMRAMCALNHELVKAILEREDALKKEARQSSLARSVGVGETEIIDLESIDLTPHAQAYQLMQLTKDVQQYNAVRNLTESDLLHVPVPFLGANIRDGVKVGVDDLEEADDVEVLVVTKDAGDIDIEDEDADENIQGVGADEGEDHSELLRCLQVDLEAEEVAEEEEEDEVKVWSPAGIVSPFRSNTAFAAAVAASTPVNTTTQQGTLSFEKKKASVKRKVCADKDSDDDEDNKKPAAKPSKKPKSYTKGTRVSPRKENK